MSDLHKCAGIQEVGDKTVICACVSQHMYHELEVYFNKKFVGWVEAFANDYHHHVEGRDVVIVEQLLAFLTPINWKDNHDESVDNS